MQIRHLALLGLMLLGLSGCSTSPTSVLLPDGTKGYSVVCNGNARSISDCMNAAGEFCKGGYTVIAQESGSGGGIVAPTGGLVIPTSRRSLVFKCGKRD